MEPGAVLREAWELYRAHWRHFIPIALIFYLALSLLTLVLTLALGWLGAITSAFVSIAGVFWLQGALVEAVQDVRDGRADLTIAETYRRVGPRFASLASAGILAALAITVGLILLIVPGLFLLTIWSVIVPVIVLEGTAAMDSFGRSRELVRGSGWNVFGVIVLTILVLFAASLALSLVLAALPDSIQGYLQNVISGSLIAPFAAVAWTLMYYRLRERETSAEPTAVPA